jgi:hypothetical protein
MVKVTALDVPLPTTRTVTDAVPAVASIEGVVVASNLVGLTYVVAMADPFHCTTELIVKFAPVTIRVPPAPPAVALDGERLFITGICAQAPNGATSSTNKQRILSFPLNIGPPMQSKSRAGPADAAPACPEESGRHLCRPT